MWEKAARRSKANRLARKTDAIRTRKSRGKGFQTVGNWLPRERSIAKMRTVHAAPKALDLPRRTWRPVTTCCFSLRWATIRRPKPGMSLKVAANESAESNVSWFSRIPGGGRRFAQIKAQEQRSREHLRHRLPSSNFAPGAWRSDVQREIEQLWAMKRLEPGHGKTLGRQLGTLAYPMNFFFFVYQKKRRCLQQPL